MTTLIICIIIGLSIATGIYLVSKDEKSAHHDNNIDANRLEMARKGFVLHKPSYMNGVEAYCLPRFEHDYKAHPWNLERI